MTAETLIIIAVALVVGWFCAFFGWRRKPREELHRMLQSNKWRYYQSAIKELRRRGEDVTVYLPRIVAMLVSDSLIERTAAKQAIENCFPDLAPEIAGFSPASGVEACRAKAVGLLSRFGVG
jgi:hypothetical protein